MYISHPLHNNQQIKVVYIAISIAYNLIKMVHKQRDYNRIKSVLAEKKKTSIWLSGELSINKTTISKWCTNDAQPTIGNLFRVAEALDVDVRSLLVSNK